MLLKVSRNVVWVSNSLDPDEMPSHLASHLDPSCLHILHYLRSMFIRVYVITCTNKPSA